MGELIRNLPENDKPLCPRSMWPVHPAHLVKTRTIDAFYESAEKDADGEFVSPATAEAYAAANERVSDRMNLYHEQANAAWGRRNVTVESWYFRCPTCGCILSAQRA